MVEALEEYECLMGIRDFAKACIQARRALAWVHDHVC